VPASGVDLDVTLDELGAGAAEFVVVHDGERRFLVC
jgi:microcompartment protein CcmK/EutM